MAVSDQQIIERLRALLGESDLQTTTEKMLRKKLEEEFKMDMLDKKPLIRQEIEKYLAEHGGDEDEEEDEGEDEDEGDAPAKGSNLGCLLSEPLQKFLGVETLPRTQVVKRLWEYIKAKNLQDPKDKRKILLDDKLKTLFSSPLTMFSMSTQLSRHCKTADACEQPRSRSVKRVSTGDKPKAKKAKAAGGDEEGEKKAASGFNKPLKVSPELASWCGKEMTTRSEVTKFFWTYVKEHNLQDAADKRTIKCDATLKKLTGQDTIQGFSFSKYINPHFLKS